MYAEESVAEQGSPTRRQSEGGMPVLASPTPYGTKEWGLRMRAVSAAISAEGRSERSVCDVLTRSALGATFGNESVGECKRELGGLPRKTTFPQQQVGAIE